MVKKIEHVSNNSSLLKKKRKQKLSLDDCIPKKIKLSNTLAKSNPIQSLTVVWFDPKNGDYLKRKGRLHSIGNYLKKISNINSCINYLLSFQNTSKNILFILPGSYCKKILPFIHNETNIIHIYIFCKDKEKHEEWIKLYSNKIRGIFINKQELLTKLNEDVEFNTKMIPISIIPAKQSSEETSMRNLDEEKTLFMWYQLLIEILNRMPLTSISRRDLLNQCRHEYREDKIELNRIQEFENTYNADNVIEWYTRDAFLYRLLNRALRTRDISIIFQFRFVLVDLHNRLKNLHIEYIQSLDKTKALTVYRGQGLTLAELNKLKDNINGRVAMNSFISTSLSSAVAVDFAGNGTGRPLIESVLFEIECPVKLSKQPFVNIQKYSHLKTENEVLFTIGTIFRIKSVELFTDDIWFVKLILCEDEINLIKDELIDDLKYEMDETTDILTLAKFLFEMGDLNKAEEFYTLLFDELPTDHPDVITIKNDLGGIYREKGEYLKALKNHKQALKLQKLLIPYDFVQLAAIYNDIGYVYEELGNYSQALKFHRKTLQIRRKHHPYYKFHFATTYNHLGNVYNHIGKKKLALKYHKKALVIKRRFYSEIHPNLANEYNNIGEVYLSIQNIKKAQIYLEKGLEIRLKSLPNDHQALAISYSNLGQVYDYKNDHKKGLECYQKALDILLKCLPSNHIDLAAIYNNIGECFNDLGDFTSALINHKKALKIRCGLLSNARVQADTALSYCNIGKLFKGQEKYMIALKYFKKALTLTLSMNNNKKLLGIVYYNMATAYQNKLNMKLAMKYFKKALKFELKFDKSSVSLDLADIYYGLGEVYEKNHDFTTALVHFEKSLDIKKQHLTIDHPVIEETLSTIGFVYTKQGDIDRALSYLIEAFNLQVKSNSTYLTSICISIGSLYHSKQDDQNALIFYQKALTYITKDNRELGSLYYQIGLIYYDKNDLDQALENFANALTFPSNIDSIIDDIHNRIGLIYHTKRYYSKALIYFKKALVIHKKQKKDLSVIYYHIAWVYDDKFELKKALNFYKKALYEHRNQESSDVSLLSKVYNNMAGIYARSHKCKLALKYFRKSLQIALDTNVLSPSYIDIADIYSSIGTAYMFSSNYHMALENYEKAINFALKILCNDDSKISTYRNNIVATKRLLSFNNE
ncbi:unnamed protein product [Adineta steineri]|uniref:NAD(P)(+)--arginine ADP-ribosyltransferase n=1 Tax=Adineta steineri TaxID=433720 RepID=A0A819NTE4_9BILA|nr:unnamed protein product [Adineta steineri]